MSIQADGTHRCDGCGADVGNGAITLAALTADYTSAGEVVNYEWCRQAREGHPRGCAGTLLAGAAVAWRSDQGLPLGVATTGG